MDVPVNVKQINVIRAELLEAVRKADVQALGMIALEVRFDLLRRVLGFVAGRELGGNDHLVAVVLLGHPLADPGFGFFVLVVVGCIDEVYQSVSDGAMGLGVDETYCRRSRRSSRAWRRLSPCCIRRGTLSRLRQSSSLYDGISMMGVKAQYV